MLNSCFHTLVLVIKSLSSRGKALSPALSSGLPKSVVLHSFKTSLQKAFNLHRKKLNASLLQRKGLTYFTVLPHETLRGARLAIHSSAWWRKNNLWMQFKGKRITRHPLIKA